MQFRSKHIESPHYSKKLFPYSLSEALDLRALPMFQRRFFRRQTMSSPAWIEVNSSGLLERCKLMDLWESGARLSITDDRDLPPQFNLYLARIGQAAHQCRIVWQRGNEVGVEFVTPKRADSAAAAYEAPVLS
jgi:hypothetical protein